MQGTISNYCFNHSREISQHFASRRVSTIGRVNAVVVKRSCSEARSGCSGDAVRGDNDRQRADSQPTN